jgi:hypothetical protein
LKKPISVIDPRALDWSNNVTYYIAKNRRVLLSSTLLKAASQVTQQNVPSSSGGDNETNGSNVGARSNSFLNLPIPELWYILQFRKRICTCNHETSTLISKRGSISSVSRHPLTSSPQTVVPKCSCQLSMALCETLPGVLLPVGFRALVADVATRNTTSTLLGSWSCSQQQKSKNPCSKELKGNEDGRTCSSSEKHKSGKPSKSGRSIHSDGSVVTGRCFYIEVVDDALTPQHKNQNMNVPKMTPKELAEMYKQRRLARKEQLKVFFCVCV